MKTRIFAVLLVAALLTGCGDVEWFPEQNAAIVEKQDLGGFLISAPGPEGFTTMVDKGAFHTFTQLTVSPATPVTLEKTYDGKTGLLVGQLLRAADQTALVKTVLVLTK